MSNSMLSDLLFITFSQNPPAQTKGHVPAGGELAQIDSVLLFTGTKWVLDES